MFEPNPNVKAAFLIDKYKDCDGALAQARERRDFHVGNLQQHAFWQSVVDVLVLTKELAG